MSSLPSKHTGSIWINLHNRLRKELVRVILKILIGALTLFP